MPHRQALHLGTGPRSVQDARRWAVRICDILDRADLAECAELAVSELVTNAVLHGRPPIWLQVRGTPDHPRIEVHDASPVPPQPGTAGGGIDLDAFDLDAYESGSQETIDISALSGFGRGLDIVARASQAWGAIVEEDGKTVWFEPASEFAETGAEFQFIAPPDPERDQVRADEVSIHVLGVPVQGFGAFQRHYRDLRREIRLLALAHGEDYPLAKMLSEHFNALELPLRTSMGREQVDTAQAEGERTVDLHLRMTPATARRIGALIDLMDAADEFSHAERLLTPARTPAQVAFQLWFLGEFRRQADGAAPVRWANGTSDRSTLTS